MTSFGDSSNGGIPPLFPQGADGSVWGSARRSSVWIDDDRQAFSPVTRTVSRSVPADCRVRRDRQTVRVVLVRDAVRVRHADVEIHGVRVVPG
jgi:hypothetical protein